jgi:TM2 domain-containing membrane protein YozV
MAKSKLALFLFSFFFGFLGLDRIYWGCYASGILKLVLGLLAAAIFNSVIGYVVSAAVGFWVFLDLIMVIVFCINGKKNENPPLFCNQFKTSKIYA